MGSIVFEFLVKNMVVDFSVAEMFISFIDKSLVAYIPLGMYVLRLPPEKLVAVFQRILLSLWALSTYY